MKRHYKRRNFFINKEFQGRFIFLYFTFSFVGVIFFALIFSFLSQDHLTIAYSGQQLQFGKTPLVLLRELVEANWIFLITVGLFIALVSMFLTHRVAGPLFRFERTFEAISNRDLDWRVVLRSKDEAKQAAGKLNAANDTLNTDLRAILARSEHLDSILEKLQEGDAAEALLLRQARAENQGILDLLKGYRFRSG
ncbi:chemotaxis protein [Geothermobacter hydrogeniphilus]|uniref:Chemotaxis protein n=1 Tax=Geothermobacter hydrogeniphilus TaxID=1969733 RepID=A0A2K2HD65_9BACT|nr:methyl-accepting chemotaxis protein [Geothermobacter hydrogeniphilus]PNU21224.1 chemotaxis protein [Geothermobacter hydrogeniphilus]